MLAAQELETIWQDDLLDRQKEAAFLQAFLEDMASKAAQSLDRKSFVVNLKGNWGSGKSFFLKRFAEQLRQSKKLVVEIDAWKADPEIDPLVTIVSEIKSQVDAELPKTVTLRKSLEKIQSAGGAATKAFAIGVVKKTISKIAGDGLEETINLASDTGLLESVPDEKVDDFTATLLSSSDSAVQAVLDELQTGSYFKRQLLESALQRKSIEIFCKSIESLAQHLSASNCGKEAPIFIIIDELDRCRPTFAIRMLERVNHLFDSTGVVFIVGTDSNELQHSIKAVYGNGFSST